MLCLPGFSCLLGSGVWDGTPCMLAFPFTKIKKGTKGTKLFRLRFFFSLPGGSDISPKHGNGSERAPSPHTGPSQTLREVPQEPLSLPREAEGVPAAGAGCPWEQPERPGAGERNRTGAASPQSRWSAAVPVLHRGFSRESPHREPADLAPSPGPLCTGERGTRRFSRDPLH